MPSDAGAEPPAAAIAMAEPGCSRFCGCAEYGTSGELEQRLSSQATEPPRDLRMISA